VGEERYSSKNFQSCTEHSGAVRLTLRPLYIRCKRVQLPLEKGDSRVSLDATWKTQTLSPVALELQSSSSVRALTELRRRCYGTEYAIWCIYFEADSDHKLTRTGETSDVSPTLSLYFLTQSVACNLHVRTRFQHRPNLPLVVP